MPQPGKTAASPRGGRRQQADRRFERLVLQAGRPRPHHQLARGLWREKCIHRAREQYERYADSLITKKEIPIENLICIGRWRPDLDHRTVEGAKELWKMGMDSNESSEVICQEHIGSKLSLFIKARARLLEQNLEKPRDPKVSNKDAKKKNDKVTDKDVANYLDKHYPFNAWIFTVIKTFIPSELKCIIDDCNLKGQDSQFSKQHNLIWNKDFCLVFDKFPLNYRSVILISIRDEQCHEKTWNG